MVLQAFKAPAAAGNDGIRVSQIPTAPAGKAQHVCSGGGGRDGAGSPKHVIMLASPSRRGQCS